MDTNLNIAECIKQTSNFGSTVVHNICNGTTQVVPWGGLDWLVMFGAVLFISAFIFLIAGFGIVVWRDS